ncbi:SDR family NAD(P)-dependent oxidoreductase [Companilactobacillus alimentarius]|uniref:SDR family NAD(P)-dependent oxidoreductase n=1 Tax=Companilactobacillus alimentarius TaxID=1602 RepID=UPI0028BA9BC9|nr:SDR family NAD(P)-dependent oxidoreductase [Companilactobacillus alimentarius]MDT6951409.1 SDR family NAD(P)-dependent oxidoreductase [Companilactobacillus alimentarius]
MKKTAVVIGVGEGLGKSLTRQFGSNDYRVFMLARNTDKLNSISDELATNNIESVPVQADITDKTSFMNGLKTIKESTDGIDVLIYNAGITAPDGDHLTLDLLNDHLNLEVVGAYQAVLELQDEISLVNGSILFTGGFAAVQPFPGFLGLAVGKAALRNLAKGLHDNFQSKNIFVGTVTIYGQIKPETHFAPDKIAEAFWKINQDRNEWEIDYK